MRRLLTRWRRRRPKRPLEYFDMEMFFRFFGEAPQLIIIDNTFTATSTGIRL